MLRIAQDGEGFRRVTTSPAAEADDDATVHDIDVALAMDEAALVPAQTGQVHAAKQPKALPPFTAPTVNVAALLEKRKAAAPVATTTKHKLPSKRVDAAAEVHEGQRQQPKKGKTKGK